MSYGFRDQIKKNTNPNKMDPHLFVQKNKEN
jgi:hypothetical protein